MRKTHCHMNLLLSPRIKRNFELNCFYNQHLHSLRQQLQKHGGNHSRSIVIILCITWATSNRPISGDLPWMMWTCDMFSRSVFPLLHPKCFPLLLQWELPTWAAQSWFENINSIYIFILVTHKSVPLLQHTLSELKSLQRYEVISLSLT